MCGSWPVASIFSIQEMMTSTDVVVHSWGFAYHTNGKYVACNAVIKLHVLTRKGRVAPHFF